MNKITSFSGGEERRIETTEANPPRVPKKRKYLATERVTYGPFIQRLLRENEYYTIENGRHKGRERDAILKYAILDKYDNPKYSINKRLTNHKTTVNSLRTRYNSQSLFSGQEPPLLLSLVYNDEHL